MTSPFGSCGGSPSWALSAGWPGSESAGRTSSPSTTTDAGQRDGDAGDDGPVAWDFLTSSYDAVATKYEARFEDEFDDKPRDHEDLLEALARSVEDPVADIGCGPGQIGAFVRQQGRRVIGIDLSPEMAKLAKLRLDAALVADMRALPLRRDSVGGLVAFYAVIHLRRAELDATLGEFHRVLRPGGRVVLSTHEGARRRRARRAPPRTHSLRGDAVRARRARRSEPSGRARGDRSRATSPTRSRARPSGSMSRPASPDCTPDRATPRSPVRCGLA